MIAPVVAASGIIPSVKKFLIAVLFMLGIIFLFSRFSEVNRVLETLQNGQWFFILLALVVEIVWLINNGALYSAIYTTLGIQENRLRLFQLSAAAAFVNVIAPSGGMSGMAVFIANARGQKQSTARVAVAGVLYVWMEYLATLCVLTLGLGVLARRNNLNWPEIVASGILLAGAIGLATLLYLGMRSCDLLARVLAWAARGINWILNPILRRPYLSEQRASSFACEVGEGISALRCHPAAILKPLLLALSGKSLMMLVLIFSFLAFNVPFSPGTILAGFSIGHLFTIVSPTPQGLGVVEGALTLALTSLWVPLEQATVLTLTYRGITFWLPLVVGMLAVRTLPAAASKK